MKKIFDIAFKDMTQAFHSLIAIMFMFVVPILMTAMFSLMFGGSDAEAEGFVLPTTDVILVNLDQGGFGSGFEMDLPDSLRQDPAATDISSIGELITFVLTSEGLADIMTVTVLENADDARLAVDNQEAGLAVIVPENVSDAFMAPEGSAEIEVYQDPTLSIGPAVVRGIISQLLDNFSASKITLGVAIEQFIQSSESVDQAQIQALVSQYLENVNPGGAAHQSPDYNPYLEIRAPRSEDESVDQSFNIVAMIMTGMMIFYVFFTGPSTTQSILREEDRGTWQRLVTTPTEMATILSGKFMATVLMVIVQLSVLLPFGYFVFKIQWGELLAVILLSVCITIAASTYGIFLVSLMQSERQGGIILGGANTILGMAGMMPIFILGIPNPPAFVKTISLFAPQGWAVDGFQKLMNGSLMADVSVNMIGLLIWAAVFFIIGVIRFRNRFA